MQNKKLKPIHPGEILLRDFLDPMGISQYRLAKDISVSPRRINEIVLEKRAISADTALRLSRYFGNSAEFWMNIQAKYDLEIEKDKLVEMNKESHFSGGSRGPVVKPDGNKTRISIRIDDEILAWFRHQVQKAGGGNYQTLMNQALRDYMNSETKPIEDTLRQVIREEMSIYRKKME